MKTAVHQVGDHAFTAPTLKEAKESAQRHIEAAYTDGDFAPRTITANYKTVLIYRTLDGWTYTALNAAAHHFHDARPQYGSGGQAYTLPEAIRRAKMHLARTTWNPVDGVYTSVHIDAEDAEEFQKWAAMQIRYDNLTMAGFSDRDAYAYATDDPAHPCPTLVKNIRDDRAACIELFKGETDPEDFKAYKSGIIGHKEARERTEKRRAQPQTYNEAV